MTKVKHAPSPWTRGADGAIYAGLTEIASMVLVDGATGVEDEARREECEANAWLIAAAPELLAALKAVVDEADWGTEAFAAARVAIAKVETP